ncbi:DUF3040 domain-containing protein [Lentzea sp. NPDC051838]|uniref:DUF3040 domain-containing protein n=1 Tax=Lentzea sp. NPDC051838 TaxID=3154849 RepID=UPI003446DA99
MLSREEKQRLLEIEQRFSTTEPDLARALSAGPRVRRARTWLVAALVGALLAAAVVVLL